jgi:hypothetical protein
MAAIPFVVVVLLVVVGNDALCDNDHDDVIFEKVSEQVFDRRIAVK